MSIVSTLVVFAIVWLFCAEAKLTTVCKTLHESGCGAESKGEKGDVADATDAIREYVTQAVHEHLTNCRPIASGWVGLPNGYQYKLVSSTQSWQASRELCQAEDSDLVHVGLRDPQIKPILLRTLIKGSKIIWIGLNDIASENKWRWIDGVGLENFDWMPGEPNDMGGNEDCAVLLVKNNAEYFKANDYDCVKNYAALCEKKMGC